MRTSTTAKALIGVLMAAAIVASVFLLPVKDVLGRFLEWAQNAGPAGAFLLGALYVPACLLFVPGWPLTLGAGFLLGMVWGTIAVSLGSVAGATAAFLAGRTLLRDMIERRVANRPKFAAIDRAIGRQGFRIVLLLRLSPVFPFNLLNYALGLTRVPLREYVLASWIGMLPATIVYVYVGSAAKSLADVLTGRVSAGPGQTVLLVVGLLAAVAATAYIARIANRALREAVSESQDGSESGVHAPADGRPLSVEDNRGATHIPGNGH